MGKGVVPDDHPLSVAAARTLVLQNADVVFLMRFNWIFDFGQPPRYAKDTKVIQLDIAPKEISHRLWECANWEQEEPSYLDGRRRLRSVARAG
jgi:thiamine pyrophosphate-dependent acetolactate synthase large subunit-like protein